MTYSPKQLETFRKISKCEECVHYASCPLWMTVLLFSRERRGPFMKALIPDIKTPCPMFFKNPNPFYEAFIKGGEVRKKALDG